MPSREEYDAASLGLGLPESRPEGRIQRQSGEGRSGKVAGSLLERRTPQYDLRRQTGYRRRLGARRSQRDLPAKAGRQMLIEIDHERRENGRLPVQGLRRGGNSHRRQLRAIGARPLDPAPECCLSAHA